MTEFLYPHASIAIFAKAPILGAVKTRMQPALNKQQSALLQDRLIKHAITTAINSKVAPVQLWCAPNTQHPAFTGHGVELVQQGGADLGERMQAAFQTNQQRDFTLLIGTDCPLLSPEDIQAAASAVCSNDVCIAPAHDGGYVLIASKQVPECFERINWGSEKVLSQSLSALADVGQSYQLLNTLPDLDHPKDLAALPIDLIEQLGIEELGHLAKLYVGSP